MHPQLISTTNTIMKISIEGNIGCGKSTLISRLCAETRLPVFLEPVEEWGEWLSLFYSDPARWGMSFNIKVLMSFSKWKNNEFDAIYERSPVSNRHVFCQLQCDEGKVTPLELSLFDDIYQHVGWLPDVILYIRTDPLVSLERMQKRGRKCEESVSLEYLTAVHNKYENIVARCKNTL
jgi:deoxyadenosine/deoxycytidine kinase